MILFFPKKHFLTTHFIIFIFGALLTCVMIPLTHAISQDEIYGMEGELDDPVYGLVNYLYLYPDNSALDNEAELSFTYEDGDLGNFNENTLAIYKYDRDLENWEYIGGTVDSSAHTVVATITETGQYAIAPAVPSGNIEFATSNLSLTFNGTNAKTIETETIYNNDGNVIADGELFTVALSNGTIMTSDADSAMEGNQVKSENGVVSVRVRSSKIAQDAVLSLTSEYEKAFGEVTITALDAGNPEPPDNLRVSEIGEKTYLYWEESSSTDVEGYFIYYREAGETGWNGDEVNEMPSPIKVLVGASYYQLHFDNDTNYDLYMTAADVAGNESAASEIITFSMGNLGSNLTDIEGHWARDYIEFLVEYGVVQGYSDNTFKPDNEINRAEALKILMAASGYGETDYNASFMNSGLSDVASGSWYEPYVGLGVYYNVVSGYPDETFRPDKSISRAEFIKLVGVLYENAYSESISENFEEPFVDVPSGEWYSKYVAFFYQVGVISGKDSTHFNPDDPITRAEASKIIVIAGM